MLAVVVNLLQLDPEVDDPLSRLQPEPKSTIQIMCTTRFHYSSSTYYISH